MKVVDPAGVGPARTPFPCPACEEVAGARDSFCRACGACLRLPGEYSVTLFQRLVEALPFGAFTMTQSGSVLFWNAAMELQSGRPRREAVGRHLLASLPFLEPHAHLFQRVFESGLPGRLDQVAYTNPTGDASLAAFRLLPLRPGPGPQQLFGLMEDVTQRLQVDHQMIRAERVAAIGVLTAGIAHNFNNILAAIGGDAQLLRMAALEDGLPEQVAETAQQIYDNAMRGGRIAQDLLAFARGQEPQFQQLEIAEVVEATLRLTRHHPYARLTSIEANIARGLPLVEADPNHLQQVFLNLVLNALQAMPNGGVLSLSAAVRGAAEDPRAGTLEVKIHDTGVGIPRELLPRIFDPFFSRRSDGSQGQGLGLAVSLAMVKGLGGDIQVTSVEGIGTTVAVLLPIVERRAAPRPPGKVLARRVLLVEEDPGLQRSLTALLSRLNLCVTPVVSPEEALGLLDSAAAAGEPFALVLSEWILPGRDHQGSHSFVQETSRYAPVLILTSATAAQAAAEAREAGARAVFTKPPAFEDLLAAVESAVKPG